MKSLRDEIRVAYELWRCMRAHPQVPAPFHSHNAYPARFLYWSVKRRIDWFIRRMRG